MRSLRWLAAINRVRASKPAFSGGMTHYWLAMVHADRDAARARAKENSEP
jgi:hypothetical protein